MQEVLGFQNKMEADGFNLQGEVKTELSMLRDELSVEEAKRREYDSNLVSEINGFLSELKQ